MTFVIKMRTTNFFNKKKTNINDIEKYEQKAEKQENVFTQSKKWKQNKKKK